MDGSVVNGKAHFANAGEPSVPAALSDVVLGLRVVDNFQLKPRTLKMNPRFTSRLSKNHFVAPPDFATIYNVNPLYQQRGISGTGQKIVIVGQSNININDVRAFRSNSGLSANDPQIMIVPFETDPGMVSSDIDEASLDVECGGAITANTTVLFVIGNAQTAGGVFDAIRHAITA